MTNYLITVPLHHAKSEEIEDALIENVITKYCIPEYIIMDQDSAFMSSLMKYLFYKFDIKIKTVVPYNHQSLSSWTRNYVFIMIIMINKNRNFFPYNSRNLDYIISPLTSQLHTVSWKVMIKYVGPVVIYKIIDLHNYLLMTLHGKI